MLPIICCAILILACSLISLVNRHELEKDLVLASVRTIIQLFVLGHILGWIFAQSNLALTLLIAVIMTVNAGYHSRSRIKHTHSGLFLDNLTATAFAIWPLAFLGSMLMEPLRWTDTKVLLPMFGMLLGNTLSAIATGVDQFTFGLHERKDEILSNLALGATVKEATDQQLVRSIRLAMTPTLNSMYTMGLVSIPGMMTGQLLAGITPTNAAIIQIIIMLLIATGTYFGSLMGLKFAKKRLFNQRGQPCF
jgi:putative ABC transport system permease protein